MQNKTVPDPLRWDFLLFSIVIFPHILGSLFMVYLALPYFPQTWGILEILAGIYVLLISGIFVIGAGMAWWYVIFVLVSVVAYRWLLKKVAAPRAFLRGTLAGVATLYVCICTMVLSGWGFLEPLCLDMMREGAEVTMYIKLGLCVVWLIIFAVAYLLSWVVYRMYRKYFCGDKLSKAVQAEANEEKYSCAQIGKCLLTLSMGCLVVASWMWVSSMQKALTWKVVHGVYAGSVDGHAHFTYNGQFVRSPYKMRPGEFRSGEVVELLYSKYGSMTEYSDKALYGSATKLAMGGGGVLLLSLLLLRADRRKQKRSHGV